MKRMIGVLFTILLFSSCRPTIETTAVKQTGTKVSVLNSYWQVVLQDTMAREITSLDAIEIMTDDYNASNIDNQWFLYVGEYPDLENAPPCTIYMTDKVTGLPISYDDGVGGKITLVWTDWPRKKLVENKEAWKREAERWNANLYIDVIPPPPILVVLTDEQIFANHSIYLINSIGKIKAYEHCTQTFYQPDWPSFTLDTFYSVSLEAWKREAERNANDEYLPWSVISGRLYSEPED